MLIFDRIIFSTLLYCFCTFIFKEVTFSYYNFNSLISISLSLLRSRNRFITPHSSLNFLWSLFDLYWILKAIIFNSLLYLKTTYLLSLIFFFLFSFFWIITCYFFFLPIFFLIVVCWFFFVYFYQEWTTSFCLKCFGIASLYYLGGR